MNEKISSKKILEESAKAFLVDANTFGSKPSIIMKFFSGEDRNRSIIVCNTAGRSRGIREVRGILIPKKPLESEGFSGYGLDNIVSKDLRRFIGKGDTLAAHFGVNAGSDGGYILFPKNVLAAQEVNQGMKVIVESKIKSDQIIIRDGHAALGYLADEKESFMDLLEKNNKSLFVDISVSDQGLSVGMPTNLEILSQD